MKERKINLMVLIIVILIVLVIGIGIGYLLFDKVVSVQKSSKDEAQGLISTLDNIVENNINLNNKTSENIVNANNKSIENTINSDNESNENTISSNVVEALKYDGEQDINVNGKKYTVSYLSEKYPHINNNEMEQKEVKLYLNDKKVAVLNLGYLENLEDVEHEYGKDGYKVELYNICKDYILVLVKNKRNDGYSQEVNFAQFCIINTEGMHINTIKWDSYTIIYSEKDNKQLSYEINDDGLIIYEPTYYNNGIEQEGANKVKYSVIRDCWYKKELTTINEGISLSGK